MPYSVALLIALLAWPAVASPPATRYWDGGHLEQVRLSAAEQSDAVRRALGQLRLAADKALQRGPYSVMDKSMDPPSGDKHDYMSFSRYWWPNPDTEDSLPYIRRDGVVNRKLLANGDRNRIGQLYDDFEVLALAAYLIDKDHYAPHAGLLLRTWFLDAATRMNPNLSFAQAVPGRADGRSPGIIDTRHFIRIMDGVTLLESIDAIESDEVEGLKAWFSEFLDWLLQSELGRGEQQAKNNHGVWFAAQASMIALFADRQDDATSIIRGVRDTRLGAAIRPDGSQPEELKRTRSLHYSLFALSAFSIVARAGEHLDIDLWEHADEDGPILVRAIDFVGPYAADPAGWEHPSIEPFRLSDRQSQLFLLAASRCSDPRYLRYRERAPKRADDLYIAPLLFGTSRSD